MGKYNTKNSEATSSEEPSNRKACIALSISLSSGLSGKSVKNKGCLLNSSKSFFTSSSVLGCLFIID